MSRLMNIFPVPLVAAVSYSGSSRSTTRSAVRSKPQWDSCGTTEETFRET